MTRFKASQIKDLLAQFRSRCRRWPAIRNPDISSSLLPNALNMHSIVVASSVTARLNWTLGVGPGLLCLTRRPFSAVRRPPLSAREQARVKARITSARKELLQLQATCDRIRKDLEAADALALAAAAAPARPRLWNQDWSAVITAARRIAAATKRGVLRFRASTSRILIVLSEAVAVAPDAKRVVQVPQASDVELEAEVTNHKTALEAPVDPHASIMLSADKIVTRIIHAIAKAGIQPYTITPFHIYCLDHVAKTANFLKVIQRASGAPPFNKIRVVGLDCETASRDGVLGGPPSLIQIAFADNLVAIFHVYRMCCNDDGKFDPTLFPSLLKNLIESETIFKTGVGISGDLEKLQQHYGIKMSPTNFADTSRIATAITHTPGPGASLATLTKRYCGEILTKARPSGQWDLGPKEMHRSAVLYAAHDARASLKVFKHMFLSKSVKTDHGSEKTTTRSAEPARIYLSHDGQAKALRALQIFHAEGARSDSVAKAKEFSVANIRVFLNTEFEGWSAQDPMTRARWSQYCLDQWFKHGVLVRDGDILVLTTGPNAENSTKGTPATKISSANPEIARGGDNIKPANVVRSDPGPGRSSAPAPSSANNENNPATKRSSAVPGSTTRGQDKPLFASNTASDSECLDEGALNVSTNARDDTAAVPVSIPTSSEQRTPDKTHVYSENRGGTPLTPIADLKSKLTDEQSGFYGRVASLATTEFSQSTPPVPDVRIFSHAVGEGEPTDLEPTTENQNSPNSAPVSKSKDSFEINTKPSRARLVQKIHKHYVERRWHPDMTLEEMARVTNGSAINALKAHAELSRILESSSHAKLDEISHFFDGRDKYMDNGQLLSGAKKMHWSFAVTALFKLRRSYGVDEELDGFMASLEQTESIKRLTPTQVRDGRKTSSQPKDTVTAVAGEPGTAATFVVAAIPAANREGSALTESLPDSKRNEVVPTETLDPMLAEGSSTDSPIDAYIEAAIMGTSDSAHGTTAELPETVIDISSQPKETVAATDGTPGTASSVVAEIPTANREGSALAESLPGDGSNGVVPAGSSNRVLAEVYSANSPKSAHDEAAPIDTSDSAHGTIVDSPIVAHVEAALINASDSANETTMKLPETVLEMTDTSVANLATSGHDSDDMQGPCNVEADPTALSDKLTEDFYMRVNQLAAHSTTDDFAKPREAATESETDQMTQDVYDAINLYSSALDPPADRAEDESDFVDNTADSTASSSTKN
ncbi:hypothetical protein BDZ88DRAFT_300730 [Geranomyces variabilis]|nr:hypothetical protein BDZ88DRAFT_300730 [Geranomyces variabilis]KAJ3132192.1 Exonuclease 3'-5' domain-containing protein 2 [Geranomyces variabilis]